MRRGHRPLGFTIVELLVVIAVTVVLLALLMPALDQAVYQAELAACAARLKAHAGAAVTYALDHNRHHLYRHAIRNGASYRPDYLAYTGQNPLYDDRPPLRPYMPINRTMACPLVRQVDFDGAPPPGNPTSGVQLTNSYAYWYGFRYIGRRGMLRLGDRLEWQEGKQGPLHRLSTLVSDTVIAQFDSRWTNSAHHDKDEFLALSTFENHFDPAGRSYIWFSYWARWGALPSFGAMDRSFAMDDGSVQTLEDLIIDDDRVVAVGGHTNLTTSGYGTPTGVRTWLPQ